MGIGLIREKRMDPFKSLNKTTERNLPVPDQLYEIRQEIKALKLVEKALVEVIKDAGPMMMGAEYMAASMPGTEFTRPSPTNWMNGRGSPSVMASRVLYISGWEGW